MFVPATAPGNYYTQAVLPEGWATGRGELRIDGDHWTYSSKTEQDGKTVYHRTTNVFSGKNRIHFEQAESRVNGWSELVGNRVGRRSAHVKAQALTTATSAREPLKDRGTRGGVLLP